MSGKGKSKVGPEPTEAPLGKRKRGLFAKDLKPMMYGFGDAQHVLPETLELMEELVVDFITEYMQKAIENTSRRGRLVHDDLLHLIRKDKRKYARCKVLLEMNEELKQARKTFNIDETSFADEE